MEYKKNRNRWKWLFPLLLFLIVAMFFLPKSMKQKQTSTICNLTNEALESLMQKNEKNNFEIQDYFFYGDILNLKHHKYRDVSVDKTTSKSIILKNLCDHSETVTVLEKFIDRHIDLSKLNEGFYQVLINDNLERKNIVTALTIPSFLTTTKNNVHKKVSFIKNQNNMLFLKVENEQSPASKIDIAVDTTYDHKDLFLMHYTGEKNSAQLSFQKAKALVDALNDLGYRATLLRKNKEVMDVYGENGRLKKLYDEKMKYFFSLQMSDTNKDGTGISLENSYLASKNIPNALMYHLFLNSTFEKANKLDVNEYGVIRNQVYESELTKKYYDGNLYIRETGGYATGAAQFSKSSEKNRSFALDHRQSVYTLSFSLGFISSEKDLQKLSNHRIEELIAKYWDSVR